MNREENIAVFRDTERMYRTDRRLRDSVIQSIRDQRFIPESEILPPVPPRFRDPCSVRVTRRRSFEAARFHEGKTAVLNFASWTNPGGGVVNGSNAQEEGLCRISTLYPCLSDKKMLQQFYLPHRDKPDHLHNGDCIYTPGVTVFKSDSGIPKTQPEERWFDVDVITCAAPNLRARDGEKLWIGDRRLMDIHLFRISRVLDIAALNGDTDIILGAFGCGVFLNDPEVVALACRKALETRRHLFSSVEFAVYSGNGDTTNLDAFRRILS